MAACCPDAAVPAPPVISQCLVLVMRATWLQQAFAWTFVHSGGVKVHHPQATSSSLDFLIPPTLTISVAKASAGYFKWCRRFSLQARKIGSPIPIPTGWSLPVVVTVPEDTRLGAPCLIVLQLYRHVKPALYYGHRGKRQGGTGEWVGEEGKCKDLRASLTNKNLNNTRHLHQMPHSQSFSLCDL